MNQDNVTASSTRRRDSLVVATAQLRPAAEFGLRVAVLAGVVVGAGLIAADLSTPVEAAGGMVFTTCCITEPAFQPEI